MQLTRYIDYAKFRIERIKTMSKLAESIYRMMEKVDGEKEIKLIPYKYAEAIKLYCLRWIK